MLTSWKAKQAVAGWSDLGLGIPIANQQHRISKLQVILTHHQTTSELIIHISPSPDDASLRATAARRRLSWSLQWGINAKATARHLNASCTDVSQQHPTLR